MSGSGFFFTLFFLLLPGAVSGNSDPRILSDLLGILEASVVGVVDAVEIVRSDLDDPPPLLVR